ncbi:MAG: glycosyltransferase family 2 protein [Candidatus Sericytochromatia bacterium]
MKARLYFFIVVSFLILLEYIGYFLSKGYSVLITCILALAANMFYTIMMRLKYRKRLPPHAPNYRPFVSVIIPAKNEGKVIETTVREMMKLKYHNKDGTPNYELMVIDDASTDDTLAKLEELKKEYPNLRTHHREQVKNPNKAKVLNDVFPKCNGEIHAIFDADGRVEPDFLEKIIPYLSEPEVGGVQAQKRISNESLSDLTAAQDDELIMLMSISKNQDLADGAVDMRGNGMVVKKEAVIASGMWNENALTEDLDMSTRMMMNNWTVRYCPDIIVKEEAVTTIIALYKQRKRWAEGGIRRYLDYWVHFLKPNVSIVKKLDAFSFFFTFYFPIWFFIGLLYTIFGTILTGELKIAVVLYLAGILAIILTVNTFVGLNQAGIKKKRKLFYRTMRSLIFNFHWMIVIPVISFRILFSWKQAEWGKTEHGAHEAH